MQMDVNTRNRVLFDLLNEIDKQKRRKKEGKELETFDIGYNQALDNLKESIHKATTGVYLTDQEIFVIKADDLIKVVEKLNEKLEKLIEVKRRELELKIGETKDDTQDQSSG